MFIAPSLGMGAGLFQEIEAFCRVQRIEMSPWEVSMIWMLHGIQSASRGDRSQPSSGASTGAGVAAVMRGIKAKRDLAKGAVKNG